MPKYTKSEKESYMEYYRKAKRRGDDNILTFGQHINRGPMKKKPKKSKGKKSKSYTTTRTRAISRVGGKEVSKMRD